MTDVASDQSRFVIENGEDTLAVRVVDGRISFIIAVGGSVEAAAVLLTVEQSRAFSKWLGEAIPFRLDS